MMHIIYNTYLQYSYVYLITILTLIYNITLQKLVCTLFNNDTCHHSGQNLLWTHSAAPREFTC